MTSKFTTWAPTIVPLVVLCLSGAAGYADLNKNLAIMELKIELRKTTANKDVAALDKYDRYLQKQMEANERRLLVVETRQEGLLTNQNQLEIKIDSVLLELTRVGNVLTKLETIIDNNNTGSTK
mgnify:FL=1|tara:strand:- start:712 stop:1083 length:372 start_codon:yes stop_codon:yes gene_type:complete